MSPSRTARWCAVGVVVAVIAPPVLNALTPLNGTVGLLVATSTLPSRR